MVSPTVAYRRLEPPSTLMHWTRRAPELSATSRLLSIWIIASFLFFVPRHASVPASTFRVVDLFARGVLGSLFQKRGLPTLRQLKGDLRSFVKSREKHQNFRCARLRISLASSPDSTIQRLFFEIGAVSSMETWSPTLNLFALVVCVVLLRTAHGLLQQRMGVTAFDLKRQWFCRSCRKPQHPAARASA